LLFGAISPTTTTTTIIAKLATLILVDQKDPFCYNSSIVINKEPKMTEFESRCYGMSQEDIREQYMQSITARLSGLEMVVMSVLSDAQELLAMDRSDAARKQMNIAKFILSEMMDAKRDEEMVLVSSDGKEIA
jgi:hypothetical protein